MEYTDHKGNKFASLAAMGRAWGIPSSTLQNRIVTRKLPIKTALTMTPEDAKKQKHGCFDHLGNEYPSKVEMCEKHGITTQQYFGRISLGWSVEKALTTPADYVPKNSKKVVDHTGEEFTSISKMCKKWGMTRSTYNARIKNNWSIEAALTTPCKEINTQKQEWEDHLGNKYPSLNAMCAKYGITHHTFSTRVNRLGWSVEKALITPNVINSRECIDYMDRVFPSMVDMCHYYGLPNYALQKQHCDAESLIKKIKNRYTKGTIVGNITIEKIIEFPYFLINLDGHDYVWHFEKILEEYHNNNFYPLPETKVEYKGFEIKECIGFPYYKIICNGDKDIWDYWKIIQYRRDTNFGLSRKKDNNETL